MWIKKNFGRIIKYIYFILLSLFRPDALEKKKKEKKDVLYHRALTFSNMRVFVTDAFFGKDGGGRRVTKQIRKRTAKSHHMYHVYVIHRPESIHKHKALVITVYVNSNTGDRGFSPCCPLPRAYEYLPCSIYPRLWISSALRFPSPTSSPRVSHGKKIFKHVGNVTDVFRAYFTERLERVRGACINI